MTTIPRSAESGDNLAKPDKTASTELVTGAGDDAVDDAPPRILPPAALRALAEAAERRRIADTAAAARPTEIGGRGGLDPVRFGDWEKGGICWDF
jgi:hypothetical protein